MVSFPWLSLFSDKIIAKKGPHPFQTQIYIGIEVTYINNSPTNKPMALILVYKGRSIDRDTLKASDVVQGNKLEKHVVVLQSRT